MAILYRNALKIGIHNRPYYLIIATDYPTCKGRHVRFGMRQSIPSSSTASCAEVRLILPSLAAGHTNRPCSSRLENRQAPCESHQIILSKSPRHPRNTNKCPENGSSARTFLACADSVLKPRRMAVTPAASQTRVLLGTGIMMIIPSAIASAHQHQNRPRPIRDTRWEIQSRSAPTVRGPKPELGCSPLLLLHSHRVPLSVHYQWWTLTQQNQRR